MNQALALIGELINTFDQAVLYSLGKEKGKIPPQRN